MPHGVSICALVYGDHYDLAVRCLSSIIRYRSVTETQVIVGANSPGRRTLDYLNSLSTSGVIDDLVVSKENIHKCPMMRRMFSKLCHEVIWWFDDDSYISEPNAQQSWLTYVTAAPESVVLWGQHFWCDHPHEFTHLNGPATLRFIRTAEWYRGIPPPSWRPGGQGEFNYRGLPLGNGRWHFVTGGCWMAKRSALEAMDWPDRRLLSIADDVYLCEAIRQQGWQIHGHDCPGVKINQAPRRGAPRTQMSTADADSLISSNLPRV